MPRRLTAHVMPVWPKSFYTFGISVQTAATEWKLRQKKGAVPAQEKTLAALLPRLATTTHWKAAGVERGMSYDRFRERVPLQTHEQLAPAIAQMQRGAADVLWPGRCVLFALTAGTSTGTPRAIPLTEELMAHVRQAGFEAALYSSVRARHAGAFRGRQLLFGSAPVLTPLAGSDGHKAFAAELSGIAALSLPAWAERHLYEPGVAAAAHEEWSARLDAIVARTCQRDISLIAGLPTWLLLLGDTLRSRGRDSKTVHPALNQIWPNLECCVHGGLPVGPYAEQLRTILGSTVMLHDVYAASEAFVAAQDGDGRQGLRLMAQAGVFFEFLPLTELTSGPLEQLGSRAIPLADVRTDVDYALILTTPGGLARYVLGDVVRFTSTAPHRLMYIGGTTQRLNAFAENVSEKEVTDAVTTLCQRQTWSVVNFHIAPSFDAKTLTTPQRGRHEWWVELKPGTFTTPTGPIMAAELDSELQRANPGYAARRKAGAIEFPTVRLVMPGVFEHWLRFRRQWGGQSKVPRCRSDRAVADELANITNFARD